MVINPEQWFDENRNAMPREIRDRFESMRMFLRGWVLYEKVHVQLANEMISHVCSKVDNPEKIGLLNETLTICANFFALLLCTEVEATLRNNEKDYPTDFIDKHIGIKNKFFNETLEKEDLSGSKILLQETIEIFQKVFLGSKPELMDIESKWWPFYKYTFQLHGLRWQFAAYQIVLELRAGKKPNELVQFTHQNEFNAVKGLIDTIENIERERDANQS